MAASSSSSPDFESVITQVPESFPPAPPPLASQYYIPSSRRSHLLHSQTVILDLHGTRFELERDTLINLPESILVVMFPNGLLLRPPAAHPPLPTPATAALSSSSTAASPSSAMQPVSSADAAAVGAAVAVAGAGAGGTGAVAGTRAVTGSRSGSGETTISGHTAEEGDHSNVTTTPVDPDPATPNTTDIYSTTAGPLVTTASSAASNAPIPIQGDGSRAVAGLSDNGGIASIGLSPVVAPLLRSGQHHHHPSESTSYTDYSDYSDYSYDDYDDDEEYDEEEDEDGGTRYQVRDDLDEEYDEDEDNEILQQHLQEPEVIPVDFDPDCLQYILGFYDAAKKAGDRIRLQRLQAERAKQLQRLQRQQLLQNTLEARMGDHTRDLGGASTSSTPVPSQKNPMLSYSSSSSSATSSSEVLPAALNSLTPQDPLQDKQAIIVLREELDYFAIPPPSPVTTTAQQDAPKPTPARTPDVVLKSAITTQAKTESEKGTRDDSASSSRQSVEEEPPLLGRTPSMTAVSVAATLKAKMFAGRKGKEKGKGAAQPPHDTKVAAPRAPSPLPPPPPPKDYIISSSPLLLSSGSTSASKRVPSPPLPPPPPSSPLLIKTECGRHLVNERRIFAALQRNIEKAKNKAEQHLMDMLCVSGFDRLGEWGYRQLQPQRTTVISVAMVSLKTTASSPTLPISATFSASSDPNPSTSASASSSTKGAQTESEILEQLRVKEELDRNQMAIAQKLLLFWRKPARKCWWDRIEVEVDQDPVSGNRKDRGVSTATTVATSAVETTTEAGLSDSSTKVPVKLWARRTWTLELVLV
ncbi:hypothetical protein EMPS_10733 [Entomortierella parvispora]|uniref:Uncharacterized protein n=1 Tax=Entomortierella parvispora TaxID=205924 RepID=A0A9P3HKG0_9FUNG|nr:hypothetical protein EMPS_10733 [Entomortierella parvispora]